MEGEQTEMAKKLSAVLLFWAISAMAQQQQAYVVGPSVDQTKINLPLWWNTIQTRLASISIPTQAIVRIDMRMGLTANVCTGEMGFAAYPNDKNDIGDPVYRGLTHELVHAGFSVCKDGFRDASIEEGFADAKTNRVYQLVHTFDSRIKPATVIWMQDILNNQKWMVAGGGQTFGHNGGAGGTYAGAAGPLELLTAKAGGNFNSIDQAVTVNQILRRDEILRAFDRTVGEINGVMPSTFVNYTRSSLILTQEEKANKDFWTDGIFFGIMAFEGGLDELTWNWDSPISQVNPYSIGRSYFARQAGEQQPLQAKMKYWVRDAEGKSVLQAIVEPGGLPPYLNTKSWPDGAYQLSGCVLKPDGNCDPKLQDSNYFLVYRRVDWTQGKMFVIVNGPAFDQISSQTLQLVKVSNNKPVQMEYLPGLVVINGLDGGDDITLTDGKFVRTFTQDQFVSTIYLFKRRDDLLLRAVTNAASNVSGKVVAGSIATIWGLGATHNNPKAVSAFPLPTQGCKGNELNDQGITKVIFSQAGKELEAPFFYCSAGQINIQVPQALTVNASATVFINLNGIRSNPVNVEVVTADPGIFVVDPVTKTGAVIFADGPKAGQLVTPENPAHPGDYLAVYATGLGETRPPLPGDGIAPPPPPPPSTGRTAAPPAALYTTIRAVTATANGIPWRVLFSGLAPGFVGLYQVNVQVPPDAAPGAYPFTISVEGERRTSNEILIAVQLFYSTFTTHEP